MLKQVLEALDRKIRHTMELVQAGIIASIEFRLVNYRKLSAKMFTITEVNFASLLSLHGGMISYNQIVKHATVVDDFGTMGIIIDIHNDIATIITAICMPDVEGLTRILEDHDTSPNAHSDIRQCLNDVETKQGQIAATIPSKASVNNKLTTQEDISNFTSVENLRNQPASDFGQKARNGIANTAARSDHVHELPSLPAYTGEQSIRNSIGLGLGAGAVFTFNSDTGELVIRV